MKKIRFESKVGVSVADQLKDQLAIHGLQILGVRKVTRMLEANEKLTDQELKNGISLIKALEYKMRSRRRS